jgi:hypothetical protein
VDIPQQRDGTGLWINEAARTYLPGDGATAEGGLRQHTADRLNHESSLAQGTDGDAEDNPFGGLVKF